MVKKAQVAARFTMEVAPALVVASRTMPRRTAAPVRSLDPIAEDDREYLAYWSEYHHQQQLQQADGAAATVSSSGGFAAAWTKSMRDLGNGKHLPDGDDGQRGRRASIRKLQGHRRVV